MRSRPNVFLFMTDQQRYDSLGFCGAPVSDTPNLDQLAAEGVTFEHCYCTAPSCVPSRASFFNVQYPHRQRVYTNGSPWKHSWVERFQAEGYHTVNIGKMHTVPLDAPCGFDQRFVVENKDRPLRLDRPHGNFHDEWDRFLKNSGVRKPSRHSYKAESPDHETGLGAFTWPLEEKYHPDVFVGSMAEWFVEQREADNPFFLQIGFPGPHPPYDPPERLLKRYDDVDFPLPEVTEEELANQPPPHAAYRQEMISCNHDAVKWHDRPTSEQLLRLRRHYAANVTLIDEQVGRVLEALEHKGYLDNSVVLFMSDHGDCLGDHGHIQKWTMYDAITRTPALIRAPEHLSAGTRVNELLQQMDLAPMLFELAGIEPPKGSAVSALPVARGERPGRDVVFAEHPADGLLKEVNFVTMVRTRDWKLVHYLDQPWGELYDLQNDPGEIRNLWSSNACKDVREELLATLRDWRIRDAIWKDDR